MSAAIEHATGWPALLHTWQTLNLPDGWKAEITEGGLAVTPPPGDEHNDIASVVHRTLARELPDDIGVYQTLGMEIAGRHRLYVPDLVVVPLDAPREYADRALSTHALLAAEITSRSNPVPDRTIKKQNYALGGVDVYVLIDRFEEPWPRVTVFSEPENGEYQRSITRPFGKPVWLPEPVAVELDTTRFR